PGGTVPATQSQRVARRPRRPVRPDLLPQCADLFQPRVEAAGDRPLVVAARADRDAVPRSRRIVERDQRACAGRDSQRVSLRAVIPLATVRTLSVLVVDDSAVVRQALSAILSQDRDMIVTVAADPVIALDKMGRFRPDVIVLDLEMPRMDGLTFLRRIMSTDPIPVVVCSGLATRGTEAAIRALEEGAVEVLAKPQLGVREFVHDSATTLIETIRAAAE